MAKDQKSDEKDHKSDEKSREKGGKERGKWEKDPLAGIFAGLILILLGASYIGRAYMPDPDLWFAWFIAGIGALLIIRALLRSLKPEWKRPILGEIIGGVILLTIGGGFILEIEDWWALLFIAVGVIMIIYFIVRPRKSTP